VYLEAGIGVDFGIIVDGPGQSSRPSEAAPAHPTEPRRARKGDWSHPWTLTRKPFFYELRWMGLAVF